MIKQLLYYNLDRNIGGGAEAQIFQGTDTRSGKPVALKELSLKDKNLNPFDVFRKVEDEYNLLKSVRSNFLVKVYELVRTENNLYIVYKRYSTDLQVFLNHSPLVPFEVIQKWSLQLLRGLLDLDFYNISHRDLKPSNILLSSTDFNADVVISDFGISKSIFKDNPDQSHGSLAYLAPEIFDGYPYTHKADVFSYGLIVYNLCSGVPHDRVSINTNQLSFPPHISEETIRFVNDCLIQDPQKRPSAYDLSKYSFIVQQTILPENQTVPMSDTTTISIPKNSLKESVVLRDFSQTDTSQVDLLPPEFVQKDFSKTEIHQEDYSQIEFPREDFSQTDFSRKNERSIQNIHYSNCIDILSNVESPQPSLYSQVNYPQDKESLWYMQLMDFFDDFFSFCCLIDFPGIQVYLYHYYREELSNSIRYTNQYYYIMKPKYKGIAEQLESGCREYAHTTPDVSNTKIFFDSLFWKISNELDLKSYKDKVEKLIEIAQHYCPDFYPSQEFLYNLNNA